MTKFDLHIHSYYSKSLYGKILGPPSVSSPEKIVETALNKGIDVISVTDHDSIQGSLHAIKFVEQNYKGKILVIPGVEVSSKHGHILAYNIYEDIPKKLSAIETIKRINDLGGVAVAAHPFNLQYSISKQMAKRLMDKFFAFEMSNSHALKNNEVEKFVMDYDLAFTVGSDSHQVKEIGLCHGVIDRKIKSVKEFLKAIKNKEVTHVYTYNKKIARRIFPYMIKTCLYWKLQQAKNLKNHRQMPYNEKIELK